MQANAFAALVDAESVVVASLDADGRMLEANAGWRHVLGWEPRAIAGRNYQSLVHPDDLPAANAAVSRLRDGATVEGFELRMLHGGGGHRWIAWSAPHSESGVITGFGYDVTAEKEHVAELTRVKEQLRSVLETAPVYILELSPDGVIRYTNRLPSGLTDNQVVGTHVFNWLPPKERPRMERALAAVLRGERRVELIIESATAEGNPCWYRNCVGPVEIDGKIVAVTVLSENVTDQRRAQIERERERRLTALGRVSAAIAHDYNTLFTTMLCSLDAARLVADSPALLREELSTLETAIAAAAQLTRHLTYVAHQDGASSERCDLSAGLSELAPLLERVAGKGIELSYELAAGPLYAALNASDLNQLMLNLITNGREAMPDGGRMTIALSVNRAAFNGTQGELLLTVCDDGPGIADDIVEHLFEPYFSTKERGSGFGLATCYGIVMRAGGEIRADRAPGGGALIELRLPLYSAASLGNESSAPQREARGQTATLLLVDDSVELRATLRRHLSRAGYYVLVGCDGPDALEVLRRHPGRVDLVISDLALTGRSGIDLLATLRQERPGLASLALAARASESALAWLREHDVPLLRKPFSALELERRVRDLLE